MTATMTRPATPAPALTHKLFTTEHVEAKASKGDRVRTFVLTSDRLDRDNEVVLPSGLETSEYMLNPVVLFSHKFDQLPVGRMLSVSLINGGRTLVGDVEFARHKFADEVFGL